MIKQPYGAPLLIGLGMKISDDIPQQKQWQERKPQTKRGMESLRD